MCSACGGELEDPEDMIQIRTPEEPVRLSPEQEGCQHIEVLWNGFRGVFICRECGAQLVIPELEEAMGLTVAWEQT